MFGTQSNAAHAQAGPDLVEVSTEAVGFQSIAGETRLRLIPNPWPASALPKPTSSLLSIASKQELLAAAGPDVLVLGDVKAIRAAFFSDSPAENNVKQFNPQLTLQIPRVSQVAFSSDESSLTLCAAEGGGLAVYDVQALKNGNKDPAFQLPTNGVPVRALIPNPAAESAHLLAIVLEQGQLMIANLKDRKFETGSNGMVMRDGVSCVSWSNKGKQLTAGLGNGTALQLTPAGEVKAEIPRYPHLNGDQHVSGVSWLDNDHWLLIYTPSTFSSDGAPDSTYVYASRDKSTKQFAFRKFPDPCVPFGMNRSPPHHFIARLREYPPTLADVLILSSTATGDVGMITCSQVPLSSDPMAAETANQYATTSIANDSRKAQLPVDESMIDTSPIGLALDLSSRENVRKPIPSEEIDASPTPLPGVAILNNEGVLSYWWFVYSDSIRQGKAYPGLVAASGDQPLQAQASAQAPSAGSGGFGGFSSSSQPAFGVSSIPATGAFAKPPGPAFGATSAPTLSSGFGAASQLGMANKSVWGSSGTTAPQTGNVAFGKPTFGSGTSFGSAGGFGSVGGMGQKQSPWATSSMPQQAKSKPSPFGETSAPSGFAAFAQQTADKVQSPFGAMSGTTSGFASLGQTSQSPFAAAPTISGSAMSAQPSFGSTVTIGSNLSSNSLGPPSTFGEPKSAWGTPALSNKTSSGLGQHEQEADMDDDMDGEASRGKESAPNGPTSNSPAMFSQQQRNLAEPETSVRAPSEQPVKGPRNPAEPSFFGNDFNQALGETQTTNGALKTEAKGLVKAYDGKEIKSEPEPDMPPAPLPPSPSTYKQPILSLPAISPLPPSTQNAIPEPPLPPSPKLQSKRSDPDPPLPPSPKLSLSPAGSDPVDLGDEVNSQLLPSTDTAEGMSSTKKEIAEKPPSSVSETSRFQSTWTFGTDPKSTEEQEARLPAPESPLPSFAMTPSTMGKTLPSDTPLGSVKPPVMFAPPTRVRDSSRSPSPVRNQHRFGGQRSLSSPSPTRGQPAQSTTPNAPPPYWATSNGSRMATKPSLFGDSARLAPVHEAPTQSSSASLSTTTHQEVFEEDDSERHIAAELAAPLEPTKHLAPFLAHQDYVGRLGGSGVPAQIEKVYRDVNSMIDTLGLNSRSLGAWLAGHEGFKDGGRTRDDLDEDLEEWCLIEVADLGIVEKEISQQLDAEHIDDVGAKLSELVELRRELQKLKQRNFALQQTIHSVNHPDDGEASSESTNFGASVGGASALISPRKSNLLTQDHQRLLLELRKKYTSTYALLAEAESALSVLRAKLVSAHASSSGAGVTKPQMPTVEAVLRTIAKMTRMVETKSGDLDVLESRMQRLKFKIANDGKELDEVLGALSIHGPSRETTPLRTPPQKANGRRGLRENGRFELYYDDTSDGDSDGPRENSFRTPPNHTGKANGRQGVKDVQSRLLQGLNDEHVQAHARKLARRRNVLGLLKKQVAERGTRISSAA